MRRDPSPATDVTLGILAGGAATRLGGRDKAWLEREGVPQVVRLRRRFEGRVDAVVASANAAHDRYRNAGIDVVADAQVGTGPLAGLAALADAARTAWLLTLPVDVVDCNDCLLPSLRSAAGGTGAWAEDDDGRQPLVALWRVDAVRGAIDGALASGDRSMHGLQAVLGMRGVRLAGVRFGNLNTPADLAAAGIA